MVACGRKWSRAAFISNCIFVKCVVSCTPLCVLFSMLFLYRRGNPDKCTASRIQTNFTTLTKGTPATDPSSQASTSLGFLHFLTMHGWPNLFNVGFMLVTLYFHWDLY